MTPDINDKFTFPALNTKAALAGSGFTAGVDDSIECDDLSAWQSAGSSTAVHFAIDRIDPVTKLRIPNTYTEWKAVLSGNVLGSLQYMGGDGQQDYQAGENTRVYMVITSAWAKDLMEALLVSHKQNGALNDNALKQVYPVGSYYFSAVSTNPATLFGFGTWAAVPGKFIVGVDSSDSDIDAAGKTGGEKQHTLTVGEMPAHKHRVRTDNSAGGFLPNNATPNSVSNGTGQTPNGNGFLSDRGGNTWKTSGLLEDTGGGQAHNNMPPFEAAYIWKRTA